MTDHQEYEVLPRRLAGVLLHPTSLPDGDLGRDAYRFVDFLANCGIGCWQTLPLGQPSHGLSPYQCLSVHAGNTALISLDTLVSEGWLEPFPTDKEPEREESIRRAWSCFKESAGDEQWSKYDLFCHKHERWLDDYILFLALRSHHDNLPWWEWPAPLRNRDTSALQQARLRLKDETEVHRFAQYVIFNQWHSLRDYANSRGILMFGDTPIFVAENSADVWSQRDYFQLSADGRAEVVAGVPPDYFSDTGQRWGNPLYDWNKISSDGFTWWIERTRSQLEWFDLLRIDHFRGFESYWSIPSESETAIDGHWEKAPGHELFDTLLKTFKKLPIVVEDLGIITPEVTALRDHFNLPGTKVLQFAFDGMPDNPYLPENLVANSVVYTGTHDNDTTLGWYSGLTPDEKARVNCAGGEGGMNQPWHMITCALNTSSRLAVIPMQDLLGLDSDARMNTPGVVNEENWRWSFDWSEVSAGLVPLMHSLIEKSGR
ncbi:MAG: 4-alpha-glucanotransferase [Candidatus Sedimenticola sp. (ex Thyasira tokunagai)]